MLKRHQNARMISTHDSTEHLKQTYKQLYDSIKPTRIRSKEQYDGLINQVNQKSVEISDLNAKLQEQGLIVTALKNDLRKLKGKAFVNDDVTKDTSDPEMIKMDMEPITPKLLNKRTARSAYIKDTQEEVAVLRDLVKHIKANYPLDPKLESAFRYTKLIQELLTNISRTCPSINTVGEKSMAVTTKNKDKRVRFTKPVTSSGNTNTKPDLSSNLVSNKPVLSSAGLSKPNTNSDPICAKCNGCMLFANHDLCVNARVRSKSAKKSSKRKVWKPTGKVFNQIGYIWKPTGRTFTIVGNACPLTRFTTTIEVSPRKPTILETDAPKPIVKLVYSRKLRKSLRGPVSKPKIVKSLTANNKEPSKSLGSTIFDVPSSSLDKCRAINNLARHGLVRGLPKLKFEKDHLCSACAMGKSKKKTHKPKSEDTNQEKLYLLHMDLCGPMRVASINGKKYILMIQLRLKAPVRRIRTDNGTEFVNQTLREYYEQVGISHETFVARTPQQNGVIERRNHTLIEAARIMLIYAKALLFLWAEAVATACYTQNRSIIRLRHGKTPNELLHNKPPDLSFLHVFGALCYPTNDSENLGKLQPKDDIGTNISKITRKPSKTSKHGHENGRVNKSRKPKLEKVKPPVNLGQQKSITKDKI
ncbi:retrovirus-related pol polyprotein from transposon TNT 1-94 [Tanacetum coccineum]|uniref:Retrovirus-related pol polyprotein from transposon TNT 1-94 n=1 Tax=Tanacetum coccineum TaxID=301880 RepID=A0ABQ5FFA1_9ASTR